MDTSRTWTRRQWLTATAGGVGVAVTRRRLAAQTQGDALESLRRALAGPITTKPLAERLWLLSGDGGNIVLFDTGAGKLLVDSGVQPDVEQLLAEVGRVGTGQLRTLVNTHWHFDHTDGNEALHRAGAEIVAHDNTLKRLSAPQHNDLLRISFPPAPAGARPTVTFAQEKELTSGGARVLLTHVAPAHTDSDIYVQFPEQKVLHTGDLVFAKTYPVIDYSSGGSINGMIKGVDTLLRVAKPDVKIVPGHGPLQTVSDLKAYRDMLATVRDRVGDAKAKGKTLEEITQSKPTEEYEAERGNGIMKAGQFITMVYKSLP